MEEHTTRLPKDTKLASKEHIEECCSAALNGLMQVALERDSRDNMSVVLLMFKNVKKTMNRFDYP